MHPAEMSQTSLKDRLLVATLPAEERENGRRLLSALAPIEGKLKLVETLLQERTRSGIPTISLIGEPYGKAGGTNTMKIVKVGEHRIA